jgi:hypothetical protein
VFLIDWYDKNQCHHNDVNGHDRSNGRIFRISYGPTRPGASLAALTDAELVAQVPSRNEFTSRHARRLLQERHGVNPGSQVASDKTPPISPARSAVLQALQRGLAQSSTTPARLRHLWALHGVGGLDSPTVSAQLHSGDEQIRAWTIQLATESDPLAASLLQELARLAKEDPSPVVRLYLASACQRLPAGQRLPILENLLGHAEDAADHNLPLLYWYATEAVAAQGPAQAVPLLAKTKIPKVREFITKRMTAAARPTAAP